MKTQKHKKVMKTSSYYKKRKNTTKKERILQKKKEIKYYSEIIPQSYTTEIQTPRTKTCN